MGRPALLELLNLIELRLEDDPVLGYRTLLELIAFVKSDAQYEAYVPILQSIESTYQAKVMPQLMTSLPIPYFQGQTIKLSFQIPSFLKNSLRFESENKIEFNYTQENLVELSFQPASSSVTKLTCYHDKTPLQTYVITLAPPVEMDNLGL
jgi:hypothetical protein